MRRHLCELGSDRRAAVAPTIALSLFALVGAGGIAFDYARMASMDTELQNAADQAALAAASQLDQETGTCSRASAAAVGMVQNLTYLANDGAASGTAVTLPNEPTCDATGQIRFYQDIGKTVAADSDDNARFVEVTVDPREVFYALTPVVAAFSSGELRATAFAGLGQAICNTPPVMICNPSEPDGNTDVEYPFTATEGDGVRLVVSSPQSPGDFGFLQTGYGTGASALAKALGYNTPPADCAAANGVDTEPGDKESVRAAFNTRFDISESGLTCPGGDANCSPSINSRKDLVKGNNCGTAGLQGWQEAEVPYRPTSPTVPLDGTNDPEIMGLPRDMCHAVSVGGQCGGEGIIGDGVWDRDAYFRVNYGWDHSTWMSNTSLPADATRYAVYKWEMDNLADVQTANAEVQAMSNGKTGYSTPICRAPGVEPDETTRDRRRISVAVINCQARGVNGRRYDVGVLGWMDVFLVEPAFRRDNGNRTTDGDIYVEVIGETQNESEGNFQVVKKAVPYLIE
jgi:Flp pilus assembly protein TadG